jgi:hypothetical protein
MVIWKDFIHVDGGGVVIMVRVGVGATPGCTGGVIGGHMVIIPHILVIGNNANHRERGVQQL